MESTVKQGRPRGGKISKMESPPPYLDVHPDKWKHMDEKERDAAVVKARNARRENRRKGKPAHGDMFLPNPEGFEPDFPPPPGQPEDEFLPEVFDKPPGFSFPVVKTNSSMATHEENDAALVSNAYELASQAPTSNDPFKQAVYITLLRGSMKRGGKTGAITPAQAKERVRQLMELKGRLSTASDAEFSEVAKDMGKKK